MIPWTDFCGFHPTPTSFLIRRDDIHCHCIVAPRPDGRGRGGWCVRASYGIGATGHDSVAGSEPGCIGGIPWTDRKRGRCVLLFLVRCRASGMWSLQFLMPADIGVLLSIQILGAGDLVNRTALAAFLARCQFKYGGIAKAPRENPGSRSFFFC